MVILEPYQERLARLCAAHHVLRLELFGSAVKGDFDSSTSDLDFLVEFENLKTGEYAEAYFGLLEDLEALFHRPIDLVMVTAIKNRYFLENIQNSRKLLYAA
ncbi:MAG: hypothetical protein A2V67_07360 [Deltaproteobacteria bacterium RBG_13_61_14]|nr:MAG: hypothetical protein A2V67_07360 [Deltaproteobacteria bacterium RBG_13_61_14]